MNIVTWLISRVGGRKLLTINEFSILTSGGEKSENRNISEKVLGIECQSVARKARELCRTFEPPRFSRVTLYFIHLSVSLSLFSVLYLLASYTETFERWFFSLKIYHDKSRNLFFSLTINTGICYLETWRTHQISLELSYTEEFSFFPFAYVTFLINVRYIS